MTDEQTRLMQQTADQGSFASTEFIGPRAAGSDAILRKGVLWANRDALRHVSQGRPAAPIDLVPRERQGPGSPEPTATQELVDLLLGAQARERLDNHVDDLLARGSSIEHIFLRVLQPAARRLGELWLEDICNFVDVTLATALLHGGLRRLAPLFQMRGRPADGNRSAILATLPGDQHTFGLAMAVEFFRRSGWDVFPMTSIDEDDLIGRLNDQPGAVVGFSISRADQLPALASAVRRVRRLGRQRCAGILVGGPYAAVEPERAREVGADGVGCDARQAVNEAERLISAHGASA